MYYSTNDNHIEMFSISNFWIQWVIKLYLIKKCGSQFLPESMIKIHILDRTAQYGTCVASFTHEIRFKQLLIFFKESQT